MNYCKICSNVIKDNYELCKKCQNKRKASNFVLDLQDKINFNNYINSTLLYNLGYKDKIIREDMIWTLEETNLINKRGNNYIWINIEDITKFVKKYDEKKGITLKINGTLDKKERITCKRCGKEITNIKRNQKYCKLCKKINKTLKNINLIKEYENTINIDQLTKDTSKESYQIEDILYDLIENDIIKQVDSKNYQIIPNNMEKFLEKHDSKVTEENNDSNIEIYPDYPSKNIKKNSKIKSKTENGEKLFNFTYGNYINEEDKKASLKESSYNVNYRRIKDFFDRQINISKREANRNDLTRKEIYTIYREYHNDKFGEKMEYSYFIPLFDRIVNEKKEIKKAKYDSKIHYNLQILSKSNSVTSNINKNTETLTEIILYYLNGYFVISQSIPTKNDLTQEEVYTYFNDYYTNKYHKDIKYHSFIYNFQEIVQNNEHIRYAIYDNKVYYNLKLKSDKNKQNYLEENESQTSISIEILDEFFDKHIIISENQKEWMTREKLYELFNKYSLECHGLKIPESGITGFNFLMYRKMESIKKIKTTISNHKIQYNLIYSEKTKDSKKVTKQNETKHVKITNNTNDEELIELTNQSEVYNNLKYYFNNNLIILNRKANENDLTFIDIYNKFIKYLKLKYNTSVSFELFRNNFEKIVKIYEINSIIVNKNIHYNLKFINDDSFNETNVEKIYSSLKDSKNEINKYTEDRINIKIPQSKQIENLSNISIFNYGNNKNIISFKRILRKEKYVDILRISLEFHEYINKIIITPIHNNLIDISLEFLISIEKQEKLIQYLNEVD